MPALALESDTLLLSDPVKSRSTVHVGVAHPTPPAESVFGKIYVIVEIDSHDRINQDIVAALQEEFKTAYYRSPDMAMETSFEAALQQANTRLHSFMTQGVTEWFDRFNAIVAVVKNDIILLSHVGRMHAFLFRGTRIVDIIGKAGATEQSRNPLKIFSNILTGKVQSHDRLILCTSSLLDFFSLEKLKRLIAEDLPAGTVSKIEQTLLANPAPTAFAAILFVFLESTSTATTRVFPANAPTAPQRSMEELIAKERATENLLSPSLLPNVGGLFRSLLAKLELWWRSVVLKKPPRRSIPQSIQSTSRYARKSRVRGSLGWLRQISIGALLGLLSLPRIIVSIFRQRRKITSTVQAVPGKTSNIARRTIFWLRSLSGPQRILLLAAITALFFLSQAVINANSQQGQRLRGRDVESAITTIEDDVNKAAAAMTYEDVAGAKKLLTEAQDLLAKLPNRSRPEKNRRQELTAKIESVLVQTRLIVEPTFTTVANLEQSLGAAVPTSLAIAGKNLIVGTNAKNSIIVVNAADGKIAAADAAGRPIKFAVDLDSRTVLLIDSSDVAEFNSSTNSLKKHDIDFPNVDRTLQAGAVFQSRLYLLDTKNNAILRSNRAGAGFGPATLWLKDETDVRDGISLAVDGRIFVTTSGGQVIRLASGQKDDISFETIDPSLSSPTASWTSERSPFLYILEPAGKRLVIFSKKTQSLKVQFVHDELSAAVAFSVDDRSGTVYLLTNSKLIQFTPSLD
ncbi:MAG: hypothetical protein HY420_02850 [Candidatus Kerfeldbacteria bacterium]|nr:hypothetical protein [Candidatus Kerfeldbacteria bacterium]